MVVRQAFPFAFGFTPGRAPSRLTVAVTVSILFHAAVVAYVAMMKFGTIELPAEPPAITGPLITIDNTPLPPPPPPKEPRKTPHDRPIVHQTVPVDTTVPPLPVDPTEIPPPGPTGQIASFDPPVLTPPAPPRPDPIIRDPRWVRRPDAGDFARFYPDRAMRMGVEGTAEITCGVSAKGELRDCRVTGEAPANFGFGQAALKLSRYLQIAPKTIDGRPVDGGVLIVPIRFRLGRDLVAAR